MSGFEQLDRYQLWSSLCQCDPMPRSALGFMINMADTVEGWVLWGMEDCDFHIWAIT